MAISLISEIALRYLTHLRIILLLREMVEMRKVSRAPSKSVEIAQPDQRRRCPSVTKHLH